MDLTVAIFTLTYIAIAIGKVPGLRVDRTGAALLGAIALIVTERISIGAAWSSISVNTMALLFGLMIVSSAFIVSGFYATAAARIASLKIGPTALLAVFIGVSALLSAFLTNDVVVLAMTPLLVSVTIARGLNPTPFLLGFCFASNIGPSATPIGSPQNIILAEGFGLSFVAFVKATLAPALLSLSVTWALVALFYRGRWFAKGAPALPAPPPAPLDRVETAKAAVVAIGVVLAFALTDWPRSLVSLAAGGVLLMNRKISSGDVLKHVDGDLMLLLIGLFVVNAALAATGLPAELLTHLHEHGVDLKQPLTLFFVSAAISNVVGNNAAVLLLTPYTSGGPQSDVVAAAMALGTGFASNMIIFGSLAGIIVVEKARERGVDISFGEFSRIGVPVAIVTMATAAGWVVWLSAH
jgi:Na+/H+ antiporter NhaD/arsenite permease-like protein